jgi:hypothetical protein
MSFALRARHVCGCVCAVAHERAYMCASERACVRGRTRPRVWVCMDAQGYGKRARSCVCRVLVHVAYAIAGVHMRTQSWKDVAVGLSLSLCTSALT